MDDNAAPSTAEATPSVSPAEGNGEVTEAPATQSAETETNTDTAEGAEATPAEPEVKEPPGRVPYNRFAEVNTKAKEATARNEELEAEIQRLRSMPQAEPAQTPAAALLEPPEGLSEREKVRFYIEQDSGAMFQRELGMTLAEAKNVLSTLPEVSQASAEVKWERGCKGHGLDPKDAEVQNLVRSFVKGGGHDFETALDMAASYLGKTPEATKTPAAPPQRMNNGTSTGAMTEENTGITFDKKKASALAQQGKRVPLTSAMDILAAATKMRAAK